MISQNWQELETDGKLFHGIFNLSGELINLYSHAQRKSRARSNMIEKLAAKLGRSANSLRLYFLTGDRIKITEVK